MSGSPALLEITATFPQVNQKLQIVDGPGAVQIRYLRSLKYGAYPKDVKFLLQTDEDEQLQLTFT